MAYLSKKVRNKNQFLVWKFLIKPEECSWPKEIKISKTLLSKYPDIGFWAWIELINNHGYKYKLNSLAYFLTKKGKVLLYNKRVFYEGLKSFRLKRKKFKLYDKKTGKNQPRKINKKLKLFDFIRYGKKKEN